jgi:hypothetical protein
LWRQYNQHRQKQHPSITLQKAPIQQANKQWKKMQCTPLFSTSSSGLCRNACLCFCVCAGLMLVAYWFCKQFKSQLRSTYLPQSTYPLPYIKQATTGSAYDCKLSELLLGEMSRSLDLRLFFL